MTIKKTYEVNDGDIVRISSFLANAALVFETSSFIRNLDYLDLFLYIYSNDKLLGKKIRFKDLSIYSSKSDVYLTKFLKNGLKTGYLNFTRSKKDKRIKNYYVTKMSTPFFEKLYNFEELD